MKSLGLAATLFTLTGALVALDLSGAAGALRAGNWIATLARPTSDARFNGTTALAVTESGQDEAAADEDGDEADAKVVDAFLVTPLVLAPANSSAVTALRYD